MPNPTSVKIGEKSWTCSICHLPGLDVVFEGCSCKAHVHCIPVTAILAERTLTQQGELPVALNDGKCPACKTPKLTSIKLLPMQMDDLDLAVARRRQSQIVQDDGIKLKFPDAPPEASYLLLSQQTSASGRLSQATDYQRTGRWSEEEWAYAEHLVEAFDAGQLLIQPGVTLGEFLSDILLCKGSRLTKKMKHAKLSTRVYDLKYPIPFDRVKLAILEKKFLQSIHSDHLRLELRFHLTRVWRSHLAQLCAKVNSPLVNCANWYVSVDDFENRGMQMEEYMRRCLRKRMSKDFGMNGQFDIPVSFGVEPPAYEEKRMKNARVHAATKSSDTTLPQTVNAGEHTQPVSYMSEYRALNHSLPLHPLLHHNDDYATILNDLAGDSLDHKYVTDDFRNPPSPFLQALVSIMERNQLPFQHADIWVASVPEDGSIHCQSTVLESAGFVTRTDIDDTLFEKFLKFGEYSGTLSFAPGVGLPGRVLSEATALWEMSLSEIDSRCDALGANPHIFDIKSGLGIPISTDSWCIVVCFYGTESVPKDATNTKKCWADLCKLCPIPCWKPVVEIGTPPDAAMPAVVSIAQNYGDDTSLSSSSSRRTMSIADDVSLVDNRIACLLGDHIPLASSLSLSRQVLGDESEEQLIPCLMSLRLLFLRSPTRRMEHENNLLEIIRKSYVGYAKDVHRTEKEIAFLIVKDWQYLSVTTPEYTLIPNV